MRKRAFVQQKTPPHRLRVCNMHKPIASFGAMVMGLCTRTPRRQDQGWPSGGHMGHPCYGGKTNAVHMS